MRATTPIRFRALVTVVLALAVSGCANAGTDLTGPGGRRASFDVAGDSSTVVAEWDSTAVAESDSTAVVVDSIVVVPDSEAVVPDDSTVMAAPDEEGDVPKGGYIVAY